MTKITLTPEQMHLRQIELTRIQEDTVVENYANSDPTEDEVRFLCTTLARVIGDMLVTEINGTFGAARWRDRHTTIDRHLQVVRFEVENYLTECFGDASANDNRRES